MARLFDDAATEYLDFAGAAIAAHPVTLACWFYSDDTAATQHLVSVADNTVTNRSWHLTLISGKVAMGANAGNYASTTGSYAANTWTHACGVAAATNDRRVYMNGADKVTNAVGATLGSRNRTSIGRLSSSAPAGYMSGRIALPAIWNVAFTDAEVAAAASGIDPCRMRPDALVGYWPIWGLHSPEIDLTSGGRLMTVTGTTLANGPPIQPFSRRFWRGFTDQAAGAPPPSGGHRAMLLGVGR